MFQSIDSNLYSVGLPTKKSLHLLIHENLEDLNNRFKQIESGSLNIVPFNEIISRPNDFKVGDVKTSLLSISEFQDMFDDTWVIANGQSVVGSSYQTLTGNSNVPDFRGRFLRMKDHGAGINPSELDLGANQEDLLKNHTHTTQAHSHSILDSAHNHTINENNHTHSFIDSQHSHTFAANGVHNHSISFIHNHALDSNHYSRHRSNWQSPGELFAFKWYGGNANGRFLTESGNQAPGGQNNGFPNLGTLHSSLEEMRGDLMSNASSVSFVQSFTGVGTSQIYTGLTGSEDQTVTVNSFGDSETRCKNSTVNYFIKINESPKTQLNLWKAPNSFQIQSIIVNSLKAGTEGILEIDIKKGTNINAMTSIFSTRPSIIFSMGDFYSITSSFFETSTVLQGQWIQLDVISFQKNQNQFQITMIGLL